MNGAKYFFWLFFIGVNALHAQEYATKHIPDGIANHAKAVVRLDDTQLTLKSYDKLHVNRQYVVTIYSPDGLDFMYEPIYYNKQTKILDYDAVVYDSNGNRIKKFKKKDFQDLSATGSSTLYAENRLLLVQYTPTTYPFTIAYNYSYYNNNTAFIPRWIPIKAYNLGVEKSQYTFKNESGVEVLNHKVNFNNYNIKVLEDNQLLSYTLSHQKPLVHEVFAPQLITVIPRLQLSSKKFQLEGYDGTFSTWEDLGKWFYDDLIRGKQDLPQEEIDKVQALTAGISSTKEKVRVLYQYMQNKTRYINVAIGIGGWQPYPASYVSKKGYGDCKALSNYMMALLEAANIPSNFTIVYGDRENRRNILSDFPAIQGNHAILNVPLEQDTIWLECTSQITAFNHLGEFTRDRYALSLSEEGGEIVKTQTYPANKNKQLIKGKAKVDASGHLTLDFTHKTSGLQYDYNYFIYYKNKKDQQNWLAQKYDEIKSKKFNSFEFINDQDNAVFIQKIKLTSSVYGQTSGDNLIFPVIPVGNFTTSLKKDSFRKQPIHIDSGFKDVSYFEFEIPNNYTLTYEFEPIEIESKFGHYKMSYHLDQNKIVVERELFIKEGIFDKTEYSSYVAFRRAIEIADKTKVLLEKI